MFLHTIEYLVTDLLLFIYFLIFYFLSITDVEFEHIVIRNVLNICRTFLFDIISFLAIFIYSYVFDVKIKIYVMKKRYLLKKN